jgi:hypothetical protein
MDCTSRLARSSERIVHGGVFFHLRPYRYQFSSYRTRCPGKCKPFDFSTLHQEIEAKRIMAPTGRRIDRVKNYDV